MSADILIIGSNENVNRDITTVLETVGYVTGCFGDVEPALEAFDPSRTGLVFIDTATVGFELGEDIERFQALLSTVEFVLIAEYQDPLIEQDAMSHGVNNWLYRPFSAPEIILKVASALESASSVGNDGVAEDAESEKEESAKETE